MKTLITLIFAIITSVTYGQSNTCACCSEEYRKFDFWSGSWQVTVNGNIAGTNDIYFIQDSCILMENWVGVSGSTGTSLNYYDKIEKTWNQLWIDNQGNNLKLKGQFDGKSMILISQPTINSDNEIIIQKISWTPSEDGLVNQLWESSKDGGKSWSVLFDGMYSKK